MPPAIAPSSPFSASPRSPLLLPPLLRWRIAPGGGEGGRGGSGGCLVMAVAGTWDVTPGGGRGRVAATAAAARVTRRRGTRRPRHAWPRHGRASQGRGGNAGRGRRRKKNRSSGKKPHRPVTCASSPRRRAARGACACTAPRHTTAGLGPVLPRTLKPSCSLELHTGMPHRAALAPPLSPPSPPCSPSPSPPLSPLQHAPFLPPRPPPHHTPLPSHWRRGLHASSS